MFKSVLKKFVLICVSFFICLIFLFSFFFISGCSKKNDKKLGDKLNVVVTNFPIYDFVRGISSNCDESCLNLKMIIPPGMDSHSFEPTPADIQFIENCDLLVYVGGLEDLWLEKLLKSIDESKKEKIRILNLFDCLGFNDNRGLVDYHVWTGLSNSIKIVEFITNCLTSIDVKNTAFYDLNSKKYVEKLNNLKNKFEQVVGNGKRKFLVVADKFPFKYFADEFGLEIKTPFLNCSSKSESSMAEIEKLINFVKSTCVPLILKIDGGSGEIAKAVAEETGVKTATFYVCHTISKEDFNLKKTYLHFLEHNLKILKEALS